MRNLLFVVPTKADKSDCTKADRRSELSTDTQPPTLSLEALLQLDGVQPRRQLGPERRQVNKLRHVYRVHNLDQRPKARQTRV